MSLDLSPRPGGRSDIDPNSLNDAFDSVVCEMCGKRWGVHSSTSHDFIVSKTDQDIGYDSRGVGNDLSDHDPYEDTVSGSDKVDYPDKAGLALTDIKKLILKALFRKAEAGNLHIESLGYCPKCEKVVSIDMGNGHKSPAIQSGNLVSYSDQCNDGGAHAAVNVVREDLEIEGAASNTPDDLMSHDTRSDPIDSTNHVDRADGHNNLTQGSGSDSKPVGSNPIVGGQDFATGDWVRGRDGSYHLRD